ncbi:MAG: DegT/DnrJ/EryC1/StrS family aminotransferase [Muribaculaceae bacterium]|nr:DegT/DnrJ/EryC1/StrS family aminotransferase [Muribaculaceae bacterium]
MSNQYPFLRLGDVNRRYEAELIEAAVRVIQSGRYVGGEEVTSFERELGEMVKTKHVVGVSNGLDALWLILRGYIELGEMAPGDEIIVPANTYIASVLAVTDCGLTPVLVDADIHTMNIDYDLIREAVTPSTRAIMTVHLYGRIAWDERLMAIARKYNLKIIEDCAQAIGGRACIPGINGSYQAGGLGDAAAFSFYPTKNIGALGDAGAVATNDPALAKAVRALANYGADRRYHNIYCGGNCRLDSLQAALLRVKLPHIDEENGGRFERALVYERMISHKNIVKPFMSRWVTDNVWHQYVIRVTDGKRDRMKEELLKSGVETDIHYAVPPHRQSCYAGLAHGELPVTERLASEVLSLPISSCTSVSEAAEIAKIINNIEL